MACSVKGWFVLTDTEILALDAEGAVFHRVPYSEVVEVRSEAVVDGGMLVLEMIGDALDLIRYSNGLMPKFGYIAKFLSEEVEHRQGKRDEAPMWEYEEEAAILQGPVACRCPICFCRVLRAPKSIGSCCAFSPISSRIRNERLW